MSVELSVELGFDRWISTKMHTRTKLSLFWSAHNWNQSLLSTLTKLGRLNILL